MEKRSDAAATVVTNHCTKGNLKEEEKAVQPPIHSQVRKIKEAEDRIVDWSPRQPELRRVLREIKRQRCRSPLGLAGRPISVGES